ncbi:MAG: uroporphyrinogen-III synthase [Terracidiphilus sp.]
MTTGPLTGRRILVTRAAHQAGKLSDGLRALGADPVEVPVLEIRPPESFAALDAALRRLAGSPTAPFSTTVPSSTTAPCPILSASSAERVGSPETSQHTVKPAYDWLIFTSANTVRTLVKRAAQLGIALVPQSQTDMGAPGLDFQTWEGHNSRPFVAAIGQATAAAARNAGFTVSLVPESYVAESLVSDLAARAAGKRILLARAAVARDVIPDALRQAGAQVDVVDAYRNVLPEFSPELLRHAIEQPIDAVTFTSSSSATHLAEAARRAGAQFPFAGVPAISIGPITSQTLRDLNWEPAAEANPSDIPGLIAAIQEVLRNR